MNRRKTFGLVLIDTPSYTTLGIRYYEAWKRLSSRGDLRAAGRREVP